MQKKEDKITIIISLFFLITLICLIFKAPKALASAECDGTNTIPCHGGTGHTGREYDSVISATDLGYIYYDSTQCTVTIDIDLGGGDFITSVNCTNPDYGWYYGIGYIGTGNLSYSSSSFFDHPWTWLIAGEPYHPDGIDILTPTDGTTVSDFTQWIVSKFGSTSDDFVIGIHYSTDESIVTDCEDFPSGVSSGYTECINGDPYISVDYSPFFSGGVESASFKVNKNTPLILGKTYYAQAVAQHDSAFGTVIMASPIISFTVGVPETGQELQLQTCTTFDIFCHLKNWAIWAFIPSPASLSQFADLYDSLASHAPFSYVIDLPDLVNGLFPATTTYDISLEVNLFGTHVNLTPSSITESVAYSRVYDFMSAMIWLGAIWGIYEIVRNMHSKSV